MEEWRVVSDLAECQEVWRRVVPPSGLSDLWEARMCFHRHFNRPPHFILAENGSSISALLPLSWLEEQQRYGFFPGETWHGKTWLEQNRIFVREAPLLEPLLARCPSPHHIRYLLPLDPAPLANYGVDEIGYLFIPSKYNYDIENYFGEFSHKTAKRLRREVAAIEQRGVQYRLDDFADFDLMVQMSIGRFGVDSYFSDPRFREGFRSLGRFLRERGWLRMVTVLIAGEPAAVDMGCVYRGVYTLLGGGTSADFPGVAKLINLFHMRRACEERFAQADFLCGAFSWKQLFHLEPRPLFLISDTAVPALEPVAETVGSAAGGR